MKSQMNIMKYAFVDTENIMVIALLIVATQLNVEIINIVIQNNPNGYYFVIMVCV
jgi:hypothetical protein